jgi:hypothetical protein
MLFNWSIDEKVGLNDEEFAVGPPKPAGGLVEDREETGGL